MLLRSFAQPSLIGFISRQCSIWVLFLVWSSWSLPQLSAQDLYVQTFGKTTDPALIFLHGGPGYNSASFEGTMAPSLSEAGFYVIVYDRRGEGRSSDDQAAYSIAQSVDDLRRLYQQLHLQQAILVGHSFGGFLATHYALKHPQQVKGLVLVGTPPDLQTTFEHIRARSTAIYQDKGDATNLYYMGLLAQMDPHSMEYASYCFAHALQNGFYQPSQPLAQAQALYQQLAEQPDLRTHARNMTREAPLGFWKNDQYTSVDLLPLLQDVLQQNIPILGLYGQEDGLIALQQIEELTTLLGAQQVHHWDHCSHSVFMDRPTLFVQTLTNWSSNHE